MDFKLLVILIMCICIVTTLMYGILKAKKKTKRSIQIINYKKSNKSNRYIWLTKIYKRTPGLKRYFQKIESRLSIIYPADEVTLMTKATKEMTASLATAVATGLLVVIISKGDMFYTLVGIMTAFLIFTETISSRMERVEKKLNMQFSNVLTNIRHYYHETGDVVDAVYAILDECDYEIGLHMQRIYSILSAVNTNEQVTEYTDIAPNSFLMMFATICATVKEYGDKKMEDGQWLLLKNMTYIKEEVEVEILKSTKNSHLFSGLKFIAISPLFFMKLIEMWAVNSFPEIASFYSGGMGTIVVTAVFAVCILTYTMIVNLRDGKTRDTKNNVLLERLSEVPVISNLLTIVINSNYTAAVRTHNKLKMVGEKIGPKQFLLKKCIYALGMFVAMNIVIIYANGRNKNELISNFSEAYKNSYISSESQRAAMEELSVHIMEEYGKQDVTENEAAIKKELVEGGIKKTYADMVYEEIATRNAEYRNTYYKWYYLLIAFILMFIGFFIPEGLLAYQTSIMKMNMEDEVVQFQTLALILMHVDGVTIDVMLEWMERFAFCFRDSITDCIINLERSTEDALQTMKDNESFPAFKRFCDNLMSIDRVGMASAFDEVESERDYYKHKREQDNDMIMERKSSIGKLIGFIPLCITVGLYMIWPFLQFYQDMSQSMTQAIQGF